VNFGTIVLEGDWAEVIRPVDARFLLKKDDVGFVDGLQVRSESMEVIESPEKISFNEIPIFLEKSGPKTIRNGAGVVVHGKKGFSNLSQGERLDERVSLRSVNRSRGHKRGKVDDVCSRERGAKKQQVEIMKDGSFGIMRENGVSLAVIKNFDLVFS
jgi:hypothetical protein